MAPCPKAQSQVDTSMQQLFKSLRHHEICQYYSSNHKAHGKARQNRSVLGSMSCSSSAKLSALAKALQNGSLLASMCHLASAQWSNLAAGVLAAKHYWTSASMIAQTVEGPGH